MSVKVSVIIPIFKVEQYIERCARSLFEQTLDDIEYIFVNDCSPDNSVEILNRIIEEYPERKPQTKIFTMTQNSGQAAVRKYGILKASGEYTIHCDSDDWVPTDAYEKLYLYAKDNSYDIVFHDYYISDGISEKYRGINIDCRCKEEVFSKMLSGKSKASLCFFFVKRILYEDSRFQFPMGNMTEDQTTILQLLYIADKIGYLQESLYYYYTNPTSLTRQITINSCVSKFKDCATNTELLESFLKNNGIKGFEQELDRKRLDTIGQLQPAIYKLDIFRIWWKQYPGLLNRLLKSDLLNKSEKIKAFITYMGMYPIYHYFKGFKFAK